MTAMRNKISFTRGDHDFMKALQNSVKNYFDSTGQDRYGNGQVYIKAGAMILAYVPCYAGIYLTQDLTELYTCYFLMGPLTVFLALNVGHEAAHGILFKRKKWNKMATHMFDFLGANGLIWKYKHVHSHHEHTNIYKVDMELEQPEIVRIFSQTRHRSIHRYQHIYMPILYSIYVLIWFLFRDIKDFIKLRKDIKSNNSFFELTFFLGKIFLLMRLIILPICFTSFSWVHIVGAFVLCNIVASITTTFALISTHVGEHSEFPLPDDNGKLSHSWVKHQFLTTSNFSTENKLVTALYGGFNHHLTHHLFPKVSHIHYPEITKLIKLVATRFGIKAYSEPSIIAAMSSHFRLLKSRGRAGLGPLEWMEM